MNLDAMSPDKRKSNVRLGLTLATVALAFMAGVVAKFVLFGK